MKCSKCGFKVEFCNTCGKCFIAGNIVYYCGGIESHYCDKNFQPGLKEGVVLV